MKKKVIRIMIADDHTIFLEGLAALLKDFEELNVIGTANDGHALLELLNHNSVDVVLTDINMPGMDGFQLTKEIKKRYPEVSILGLTMHNDSRMISKMLKCGVTGYILKNTGKKELLEAIKTVANGEVFYSEEVKETLMNGLLSNNKNSSIPELTQRELEILKLIAAEYTQQEIADKLFLSSNTVIFHRRNLLHKFNVKNTAGLIKSAMDYGFLD